MGTKDLVPLLLEELGVNFHVEKVRMKPGKPFVFGTKDGGTARRYVAGLPGNPVSAYITFVRFVGEIIARLSGRESGARFVTARTGRALQENADREFYIPCALRRESLQEDNACVSGEWVAEPLTWKGSADLFSLARAQGLVVRRAGDGAVEAGGMVRVLFLDDHDA